MLTSAQLKQLSFAAFRHDVTIIKRNTSFLFSAISYNLSNAEKLAMLISFRSKIFKDCQQCTPQRQVCRERI